MQFYTRLFLAHLLFSVIACKSVENGVLTKIKSAITTAEQVQVPDSQTIQENHKILLIRVAGDQSKLSEATRTKISTLTQEFNATLAQFQTVVSSRALLLEKLKKLETECATGAKKQADAQKELDEIARNLSGADEALVTTKSEYDEKARQFSLLIEEVKKERSRH